jgi:hypothetical protein
LGGPVRSSASLKGVVAQKGGSTPWGQAAPKARGATTTKPEEPPKGIMLHHKLWFRVTRRQKQQICGPSTEPVREPRAVLAGK